MPTRSRKRPARKATHDGECRRCGGPIREGQNIALGRTEFAHPACARLNITKTATERSRFVMGSQVGKSCDGCGFEITEDDEVVTVMTVPWHKECRLRR